MKYFVYRYAKADEVLAPLIRGGLSIYRNNKTINICSICATLKVYQPDGMFCQLSSIGSGLSGPSGIPGSAPGS